MKTTEHLIEGFAREIEAEFNHPYFRFFGKVFYEKSLPLAIKKRLESRNPEWIIIIHETDDDYIMDIREQR